MGFSRLSYAEYWDSVEYWAGLGVTLPKWADEVVECGGIPVSAVDFYSDIFGESLEEHREPEDYRTGEYGAIAIEKLTKERGRRITITAGNAELYDLIDKSKNFCMMSPISYAGKARTNKNARYLYALVVEIDKLINKQVIREIFYLWNARRPIRLPQPTYIVCSGNGVHLYYVFERAIPLYANIYRKLAEAKTWLTYHMWHSHISKKWEKPEYESVNQPFRIVGTICKDNTSYAMAFEVGEKLTIEQFNERLPEEYRIDEVYKSKLTLEEAKELYPEWYQRRIVEGKKRGCWSRHEGIYHDWLKKMEKTTVGHRFNALENLCSLAVQCGISPEQVESDCRKIAVKLEEMTDSEDNHFTEYDIICALKTYHRADETAYRRNIEVISAKTAIPLKRAKRNGRKQAVHLKVARAIQQINDEANGTDWRSGNGRPSKKAIVSRWRLEHPDGKKIDCERETGLSRPTVLKWWDYQDSGAILEHILTHPEETIMELEKFFFKLVPAIKK